VLVTFIPTLLIPAWQQARRSRKGRGTVACREQGRRSGTVRSQSFVRVSCTWLGCISEDEIQWGVIRTRCYTTVYVASRQIQGGTCVDLCNQFSRHVFNEKINGIESQPKYSIASRSVNTRSPNLVRVVNAHQHGDGVPIVPNGWPVMGSAIGIQSGSSLQNKMSVMTPKPEVCEGKWGSSSIQLMMRTEDC
jgi:hypothetical protein